MTQYYYSVQPFLAWCLNHYFYKKSHFAYIGAPFYPHLLSNPRSSRPLRIYEDYYEPWKEDDEFSDFIRRKRVNVRKGIRINNRVLTLGFDDMRLKELGQICSKIDPSFYYPVVYRVDIEQVRANEPNDAKEDEKRLQKTGSGAKKVAVGQLKSNEFTLTKLLEKNSSNQPIDGFDVLFDDLDVEIDLHDKYIQSITKIPSQDKAILRRENKRLESYRTMKKLRDERDILTDQDIVINLLKQHFRRK